jgi:hypothetical protein
MDTSNDNLMYHLTINTFTYALLLSGSKSVENLHLIDLTCKLILVYKHSN